MKKFDPSVLRTLAVVSPSAQTTTLCGAPNSSELELETWFTKIKALKNVSDPIKAYILILFTSGLRITEMLNIKGMDIDSQLNIKIKGLKGSSNRIIQPIYFRNEWLNLRRSGQQIGDTYSRFYFYRLFKSIGLYNSYASNLKASVTHYPRYLHLKQLSSNIQDMELIKSNIGHKSVKNTKKYIDKA